MIFGFIVLQGPISVGFGTLWPKYDLLIKSWKEILMLVASILALIIIYIKRQFVLLRDPILLAIGAYAILHVISVIFLFSGFKSSLAGLLIDLRYVLYFVLVYLGLKLYPDYKKKFIKVGIIGALIVLIFALLQVFVLPNDVLKYIGYNVNTISPYLTVDQNHDFIRINSTLRGPNPLGAYAGLVLTLIVAAFSSQKVKKNKHTLAVASVLAIGSVVALWASYSRSAWIGAILSVLVVLLVAVVPKLSKKKIAIGSIILSIFVVCAGFFVINNTQFASNVLLHENPNDSSKVNSNEGHINSLKDGISQLIDQPFGVGVGSTGSASLYTDSPIIIENQYLFTAHELGWLGLIIFLFIFGLIMKRLWKLRSDWLALGVFASGLCLAVIGLLLPVWVDDTVAIIWWGLAAIACSGCNEKNESLRI